MGLVAPPAQGLSVEQEHCFSCFPCVQRQSLQPHQFWPQTQRNQGSTPTLHSTSSLSPNSRKEVCMTKWSPHASPLTLTSGPLGSRLLWSMKAAVRLVPEQWERRERSAMGVTSSRKKIPLETFQRKWVQWLRICLAGTSTCQCRGHGFDPSLGN